MANPQAADAAGINVIRTRYIAVLIIFLAGTAGVLLIVQQQLVLMQVFMDLDSLV